MSCSPAAGSGMSDRIPDKLYFKIGEVVQLTGIKAHVLRYWESEFGAIRPVKAEGSNGSIDAEKLNWYSI
jgi:hypothetical protein